MQLSDFDFDLPTELIARYPLAKRSASRLLCLAPKEKEGLIHCQFSDIIQFIHAGDLLVVNDTKVIPARLFGRKETGGQVEVLVERVLDEKRILAHVRASKSPKLNDYLLFSQNIALEVIGKINQFYELSTTSHTTQTILSLIETIGEIPLPHYLNREADEADRDRYQTVYSKHKGSVAAPTAGFHFDEELLQKLAEKNVEIGYLTLHIGAGTFTPVRTTDIREHIMHPEYLEVSPLLCEQIASAKAKKRRVIAVGTTSLRALETASRDGEIAPYRGDTNIFIYPGFQFNCVDALITNLHLPRSTLLMLVSAFGGYDSIMRAYQTAVKCGYRFYSYGDAMWMEKQI